MNQVYVALREGDGDAGGGEGIVQSEVFDWILNAKGKRYLARDLLLMMRVVIVRLVG